MSLNICNFKYYKQLKNNNTMSYVKYDEDEIRKLHSEGLTDREIASELNVKVNNLATKRRRMGLKPNKNIRDTYVLSKREKEILIGTLLGDSTIRYVHDQCKYPNLTFSHGVKQKEWFYWKEKELVNLKSSSNLYKGSKDINGDDLYRYVFTGKNMKCLIDIRDIFYKDNIKIMPRDYINKNFTDLSLYCYYLDDGSYDISNNSFILNTYAFDKESLKEFTDFLYQKFDLNFSIKSDNTLYLRHESNDNMTNIIKKHNECDSMIYKYGGRLS